MWPLWSQFNFGLLALEMAEQKWHLPMEPIHDGSVLSYSLKGSLGAHSSHQASHPSMVRIGTGDKYSMEGSAATGRAGFAFL